MIPLAEAIESLTESLLHPRHAAVLAPIEAKLKKLLVGRFKRQRRALLKESRTWLKWLSDKYSEADKDLTVAIKHAVTVNIEAGAALTSDPSPGDVSVWAEGIAAAAEGAGRVFSIDFGTALEQAQKAASAYADEYLRTEGFQKLAADIDDTSVKTIANSVADVYASGGSYQDAVKAIEDSFDAMTPARAEMIARTELADVYNSAMLASAKEVGGMLKQWNTDGPDPCDECIANEDQGPIGLDDNFQSGNDAPPAHPNCQCSVSFATSEEPEQEKPETAEPEEGTYEGRKTLTTDGITYQQDTLHSSHTMIAVDTDKLDQAWKRNAEQIGLYIGAGGENQVTGRYGAFGEFLATTEEPIIAPVVYLDANGDVTFENGRHRFAVIRDQGHDSTVVSVSKGQAKRARDLLGV